MPTYEYECQDCKFRFEEFQRMSDPAIKKCPKCGGRVRRIISGGAGLIFKGSGFYATDYKKSSSGGSAKKTVKKDSEAKPEAGKDKKEEKKSDAGEKKTESGKTTGDKKTVT